MDEKNNFRYLSCNMSNISGLKYFARRCQYKDGYIYKPIPFWPDPVPAPVNPYPYPQTLICYFNINSYLLYRFSSIFAIDEDKSIYFRMDDLVINHNKVASDNNIMMNFIYNKHANYGLYVCHDLNCCLIYDEFCFFDLLRNFLIAFSEINSGKYRNIGFELINRYGITDKGDEMLFSSFTEQDIVVKTDKQRKLDVFKPEWWGERLVSKVVKNSDGYWVTFDPGAHVPQDITVTLSDDEYETIDANPSQFNKIIVKEMARQKVIVR